MASSKWIKCISTQGSIRGVALEASELVQEAVELHGATEAGACALGEALMGALLIASFCKDRERVNLNIRGSSQISQALVDAHPDGTARGYIVERQSSSELPRPVFLGTHSNLGPWGEGLLSVLKTKTEERNQPYIGTVPLATGYLAKDLTFYWVQSEQIPSAVGLAVEIKEGKVLVAGGFLVQALPGAHTAEVRAIEEHIQGIQSLGLTISENPDPMGLLMRVFQSTAFMVLEEKSIGLQCDCSWERVKRALALVGVAELRSMLAEDHEASVRCDFCRKEYRLNAEALEALIEKGQSVKESLRFAKPAKK